MSDLPVFVLRIPRQRSRYVVDVLERGHNPGVLSGAELRGAAKRWGASYAAQRAKAQRLAAEHGLDGESVAKIDGRLCRVWTKDDKRIRISVIEEG